MDPNIVNAFAKLSPTALGKIGSALSQPIDALRVRIQNVFGDHVRFTLDRCSEVKTIVADERPVNLRDIYVRLKLSSSNKEVDDFTMAQPYRDDRHVLVKGTAGAGKTMLMKYLALETYANGARLPIFIDLRDIGDPRHESFVRSIFKLCTPEKSNKSYDIFHAGLVAGLFSFFFDGLDEVNPAYRDKTFQQIQRFPFDYPDVTVTISTRPETEVGGFTCYRNYDLKPLSLPQSLDLIEKTDFHDEAKKRAFMKSLEDGLYEEKISFSSNPLLCLLMLMTFSDSGEIPDRAAIFYDQAFDTLFSRHDISKGPFRRIHRSGLRKREFRSIFGLFCYRTLAGHQVSFDDIDVKRHLERCIGITEYGCDADDLLMDLLEGVCLMQRDGGKIHFIHRSFQEFFAADFLAGYRNRDIFQVFDQILSDPIASRVAPLLYDIAPALLEDVWMLVRSERAIDVLDRGQVSEDMRYLNQFVDVLMVSDTAGRVEIVEWKLGREIDQLTRVLSSIYPENDVYRDGVNLIGIKMFPDSYGSFREFLTKHPSVPRKVIRRIEQESADIEQANRERSSMSQRKIQRWILELEKEALSAWVNSTEVVQVLPRVFRELQKLNEQLGQKKEQRSSVNILS